MRETHPPSERACSTTLAWMHNKRETLRVNVTHTPLRWSEPTPTVVLGRTVS